MKTPFLRSLLLGGAVSLGLAQAAGAYTIDFGAATVGTTDTTVAVMADNLGGSYVSNYDLIVNYASTLTLNGINFDPTVYGGAANVLGPFTSSSTAGGTSSTEVMMASLLFDPSLANQNPLFQAAGQNGNSVVLFTLDFANDPTGKPLDLSSLKAPCPSGTQEVVDANAVVLNCTSTSVPEPDSVSLLTLGFLGVGLAAFAARRRTLSTTAA